MILSKQKTIRQEIIELLIYTPCTAKDVSHVVRISEKEFFEHLPHISKSLIRYKQKLIVKPYICLACNYEFTDRKKFDRPTKCPKCREQRIEPATFKIESIPES